MAVGTGSAFTFYRTEGVQATIRALDAAGKDIRTPASKEMRLAARKIGQDHIIPALKRAAPSAPSPIAPAIADTARAINDRAPVVKVGYVNPKLRGWKRGATWAKQSRGALAYGSEYGPKGGRRRPTKPGQAAPSGPVDHYRVPRSSRGYWVGPTIQSAAVTRAVLDAYGAATERVFRHYGLVRSVFGRAA